MRVYYDRDADLARILDKKIAIVGYGSQGRAHALNLRDSGVKNVAVALRPDSATARKVEADGLKVMSVAEAARWADALMVLAPDELQRGIYNAEIAPNLRDGAALLFAHGLNIHFNLITVPDSYPLPNMMDFAARMSGCTIFSKVDLRERLSPDTHARK